LAGTALNQKKSKRSFMKTATHHGLFATGGAACEKLDGRSSVRPVQAVI